MGLFSFAKDALQFENFHAKDLWRGIKKDPKRLILGVDPLSTKVWNKVLGRHDSPLVDQMGGAYGGHTVSAFGNQDGGVYGRARAAGIDTNAGSDMQNAAHVVAAIYGGRGLMNIGGGGEGAQSNPMQQQMSLPQQEQQHQYDAPQFDPKPANPIYTQVGVTTGAPITYGRRLGRLMRG